MQSRGMTLCALVQALVLLGACRNQQFALNAPTHAPIINPISSVSNSDSEYIDDSSDTPSATEEEDSTAQLVAEEEMNRMDDWELAEQQVGSADEAVAAPGLAPSNGLELAIQDDPHFVTFDAAKRTAALDETNKLGASHVRVNVAWIGQGLDATEFPKDPCVSDASSRIHDKPCISSLITEARMRPTPVSVQLTLTAVPVHKKDCRIGNKVDERSPSEYAQFVTEAIRSFCPLGVTRYSFFNEPDLGGIRTCLPKGTSASAHYRRLYVAGYNAARRAAKSTPSCDYKHLQLLIGELSSGQQRSLDWLYRVVRGHKIRASGIALHPYQFNSDPRTEDPVYPYGIGSLKKTLNKLADFKSHGWLMTRNSAIPPLYLTEFGYRHNKEMCCAAACGSGPACKSYNPDTEMCSSTCIGCPLDSHKKDMGISMCVPEIVRQSYLTASLDIALSQAKHGVRQVLYYHLYPDDPTHPGTWDSSLITHDPMNPYSPSYIALHGWACTHGYLVCP